jgi:hypothetical protein
VSIFDRIVEYSNISKPSERVPKEDGGMLVEPSDDGSRPGYKGSSYSGETIESNIRFRSGKYDVSYKGKSLGTFEKITDARRVRDQALEAEPRKKTGTVKKGTRGYVLRKSLDKFLENNKTNPSFEEVTKNIKFKDDYDKRRYKKVLNSILENDEKYSKFKIDTADRLNKSQQDFIVDNFELPKGQKNWDFKNQKYGININENPNLAERIKRKLDGPKKFTIAADSANPSGWMMNAMNRLYKNEIKKGVKPKDLTYQPVKNEKGIIIGFKDNTAAGGGNTYYGLKKNTPENATPWTAHGNFSKVSKFLDIAKGAQVDDPSKLLQKILDDKGITKLMGDKSVLTLNDVLSHERYFSKLSDIAPRKLIERQIVLHHTKGVGANDLSTAAATKDLQLLTGAVNDKVKRLEEIVKGTTKNAPRKLNPDEILKLKNYGAKIVDLDGKVVGGGFLDPSRQFANIEKGAIGYAKSDQFNVKTVASYLERLGCGKAAGGRVFYNEGAMGLTKCAMKGRNKLEQILLKGTGNTTEQTLAKQILKAGPLLKDAVSLRGLFGPAALAFTAATEAGFVGYDMLAEGKTFREAVGDSLFNYALGPKTKIDSIEERNKRFKKLGVSEQDIGKIGVYESALQDLEKFDKTFEKSATAEQKLNEATQLIDPTLFPGTVEELQKNLFKAKADVQDLYRAGDPEQRLTAALDPSNLKILQEAQNLATVDKLTSKGPKFFGTVFPKYEQSRQERILDASSVVNPAFNIPGMREATGGYLYGFAGGGLASLTKTIPPKSGPQSEGLLSLKNRVINS